MFCHKPDENVLCICDWMLQNFKFTQFSVVLRLFYVPLPFYKCNEKRWFQRTKKNKKYCTYLDHMVETALFQKLFESSENCVEKKMKFEWRYLRYKFNPNESKLEAIPTGIDRWKGEMYKFEINYIWRLRRLDYLPHHSSLVLALRF